MPTWVDKILSSQSVQLGLAVLALLIALWLVIVIARMLMGGRLRLPGGRTRQARLGIVDAFDLDRQRQLIIVRRDNTEHLIMIGGPNDLVIESEIVRVEARDFRDTRRDKSVDGVGDVRIPAPIGMPGGEIPPQIGGAPRLEEPMLPMPLPQTAAPMEAPVPAAEDRPAPLSIEPSVTSQPQRTPTFPLPPRRPMPLPERRPPPPPERVTRTEDQQPPPFGGIDGPQPAQAPPIAAPVTPPAVPSLDPDVLSRPVAPARSFLKPLPPRPPIRPLKRVTPQAEPAPLPPAAPARDEAGGISSPNATTAPPPAPEPMVPPPSFAPPPLAPAADHQTDKDALDSLEEEMAKLLGRGS